MGLHSGYLGSGQFRHLAHRPSEAVDQDDGNALALRKPCDRLSEFWLDQRFGPLASFVDRSPASTPAATLSNPEEVASWVLKFDDTIPVLPCPPKRLGGRLASTFRSEDGKEGASKPRFDPSNEDFELLRVRRSRFAHYLL